jgi:collagenase-like PrtC family protease
MRITAPLSRADEAGPLIAAGADELYCGMLTPRWESRRAFPNARTVENANLRGFDELRRALDAAKASSVPLYFCANAPLGRDALDEIKEDIARAVATGVDGVIVLDLSLIPFIKGLGDRVRIILSALAACQNARALDFFARMGADRVVLDLQLTLAEIMDIRAAAGKARVETEVFISNVLCLHVNGFCLMHGLFGGLVPPGSIAARAPCRGEASVRFCGDARARVDDADRLSPGCAVCSMLQLREHGVDCVKIIGRGLPSQANLAQVRLARRYLDGLESGDIHEGNFMDKGRSLYREAFGTDCRPGQCHHLEVRRVRGRAPCA